MQVLYVNIESSFHCSAAFSIQYAIHWIIIHVFYVAQINDSISCLDFSESGMEPAVNVNDLDCRHAGFGEFVEQVERNVQMNQWKTGAFK